MATGPRRRYGPLRAGRRRPAWRGAHPRVHRRDEGRPDAGAHGATRFRPGDFVSAAAPALGDIQGLATALGLLDGSGDVRTDWLTQPGRYLSTVLADQGQRSALI